MRWKSVALAGAALPGAAGCNLAYLTARNVVNEPLVVCTQVSIHHELRSEARGVWQEVRAEYPRHAFTPDFRDGFLDGYVDYLDRGGNGSMLAEPPSKYTRHKKYYTENGNCLVKDYFLGFKYGQEIAIASGKRQFLTIPVLLPKEPTGPPAFTIEGSGSTGVPPMPTPTPPGNVILPPGSDTAIPINPPPAPPRPQSGNSPKTPAQVLPNPTPPVSKFGPFDPSNAERLPAPNPPLPIANPPVVEVPVQAPLPAAPPPRLPAPPPEVPQLPAHIPTPSVLDELPVVPPVHADPPPVPPSHPEPVK